MFSLGFDPTVNTLKTVVRVRDGQIWGRWTLFFGLWGMLNGFKVRYLVMKVSWLIRILEFYASSIHFINIVFIIITASDTRAPPHGPIKSRHFESSLLLLEQSKFSIDSLAPLAEHFWLMKWWIWWLKILLREVRN